MLRPPDGLRRTLRALGAPIALIPGKLESQEPNVVAKVAQIQLRLRYRELVAQGASLPPFEEVEYRGYSQNGEDGILWFLFSVLGVTNRRAVEICAGDGLECNSANLIVQDGFDALLVDGEKALVERGRRYYALCPETRRVPPTFLNVWVTRDGVNKLVSDAGFAGDIDLLSLDLDGVDWWIWQALTVVRPRVVVLEYNNRWSEEHSVTVPYRDDFATAEPGPRGAGWFGASLPAFVKLGRDKGYRLVGANRVNTNAFFLREDLGGDWFPEVSAEACLSSTYARRQQATRYALIRHLPIEVV